MYTPDPDEKFDFQNMDVKLYLALKAVIAAGCPASAYDTVERALCEFEQSFGPLPDWAISRNWAYELVPGAQLCTKDGRRTGNAHIVKMGEGIAAGPVFVPTFACITDAGSKCVYTEQELLEQFSVGDWISDPARILRDFDRNGEFANEQ